MMAINDRRACTFLSGLIGLALLLASPAADGQPKPRATPAASPSRKIPRRGAVYVDVTTDNTGAVARLEFLNNVAPEVQEWIRSKTMGRHFGVPSHTYRRHVEYELPEPAKAARK